MDPPPLTILHVPPAGLPTKALVPPVSQIAAVAVVFTAGPLLTFTTNVPSAVVAGQLPLAAIVYLTVTVVLAVMLAGV